MSITLKYAPFSNKTQLKFSYYELFPYTAYKNKFIKSYIVVTFFFDVIFYVAFSFYHCNLSSLITYKEH